MYKGAIRSVENNTSYMTIGPQKGSFIKMKFEPVVLSSPYLLDCEVESYPGEKTVWEIHGAFNGIVEEQQGHILVGFIATETKAFIHLVKQTGLGHLFKCELTRVD